MRAQIEFGVELSADESGVKQLDQLARQIGYLSGVKRAEIETEMADFVAEALQRQHGGVWDRGSSVYMLPNGTALNVGAWVAKRLRYGAGDSLHAKFRVAGHLANPRAEPDWDPTWPQDRGAAELLEGHLGIAPADAATVDDAMIGWLKLRKATYVDHGIGRIPEDDELDRLRGALAAVSGSSEPVAAYALARRHKGHACVQHWQFGNSLSGPSSYLVDYRERLAPKLRPEHFLAFIAYLAPAPQSRQDLLLEMIWRVEKASKFRHQANAATRRVVSSLMIRLVTDAHAWTATKHVKRLLEFVDPNDEVIVAELRRVQPERWLEYWAVVKRIVFSGDAGKSNRGLPFGADVLAWLDSSRGSTPAAGWNARREALLREDAGATDAITRWLDREGESLRRLNETSEVIEPVSRWVKGARWHRQDVGGQS